MSCTRNYAASPEVNYRRDRDNPLRQDYEYARHGHCNLFLVVEPLTGFRAVWVTKQRTKLDFAAVLKWIVDDLYPEAEKIVLVTDNLNIHTLTCLDGPLPTRRSPTYRGQTRMALHARTWQLAQHGRV